MLQPLVRMLAAISIALSCAATASAQVRPVPVDPFFSDSNYLLQVRKEALDAKASRPLQLTCITVRPDGAVRVEHGSFDFRDAGRQTISEGKLSAEQLQQLKDLLSAPEFATPPESAKLASGTFLREGEDVVVRYVRDRKAVGFSYFKFFTRVPGQPGPNLKIDAEREKLLKPLMAWLKINVEKPKFERVRDALPQCSVHVTKH